MRRNVDAAARKTSADYAESKNILAVTRRESLSVPLNLVFGARISRKATMRRFLGLVLGALTIMSIVVGQPASKRGMVGNLKDHAADGCGCYFQFRGTPRNSEKYIFSSSIEDEKTAWMNIDGHDVKLTSIKEHGPKTERVGGRSWVRFAAGDITVSGTYVVTRVCKPNDENCESTGYSATFVVRKGAKSQLVKAVGSCGC